MAKFLGSSPKVFASGSIPFGLGSIASGDLMAFSGSMSGDYEPVKIVCNSCGKEVNYRDGYLSVNYIGKLHPSYCFDCAGYESGKGMVGKEDWIWESISYQFPDRKNTPVEVVADWLEDHQRLSDADYLRERERQRNGKGPQGIIRAKGRAGKKIPMVPTKDRRKK